MPNFTNGDIKIAYDVAGDGPPVLLLHGFPQTRALWTPIAEPLASRYTVVTADLRGYGDSSKPTALPDLSTYSFRAMADDQRALMHHLGFRRFHLVGHDRGARVSYRLALDTPDSVASVVLMDIVPTDHLLENWTYAISKAYFHWSYLAQPAPFPERMIEADADHFYESCLLGWGGAPLGNFKALDDYRRAWRDPKCIAAMTNDYRASVSIDHVHDRADDGRQLDCPALVLYGENGVMARCYDVESIWRERLSDMTARAIPGGHFFIDQHPGKVCDVLASFLSG